MRKINIRARNEATNAVNKWRSTFFWVLGRKSEKSGAAVTARAELLTSDPIAHGHSSGVRVEASLSTSSRGSYMCGLLSDASARQNCVCTLTETLITNLFKCCLWDDGLLRSCDIWASLSPSMCAYVNVII